MPIGSSRQGLSETQPRNRSVAVATRVIQVGPEADVADGVLKRLHFVGQTSDVRDSVGVRDLPLCPGELALRDAG